ncbi:MAG: hypothetical protein OP8BY_1132 [Candidatus Saccharicenans subterraneus]|uniref:Uncharacterized protein n=1 Tax=Candidatus Saccharicenans subterraneus TaxID=2508984 RepID=A0A3E2BK40_9BACT|nr:MAG: hypothetical protein OP8BY_1132 [Candidatus Saccharicenans subterraneum]
MAQLPDLPKGKEFEEYISAFFQCGGYYVERNIIEREEKEEVLELDIVATNYEKELSKSLIVEVKTGDWGFPDIFKIKGWLDYLGYSEGILITNISKERSNFFEDKANNIGISLLQINDLSNAANCLNKVIPNCQFEDDDFHTWRFSYWIERNLLRDLKRKKKQYIHDKKSYKELDEYYFLLNSGVFFTDSVVDRVRKLYDTFMKFPRISAKCGNEMIKRSFDEDVDKLPQNIYEETFYKCKYNAIQISTYIEHRARLALLKSAIDYILGKNQKRRNKDNGFGKNKENSLLSELPESFKKGINQLKSHKYFYRYPVFWQWFMWLFGGFILKDYEDQEYKLIADKSGIPVSEVQNALESYQILFPQENGWFIDLQESNIRCLKMFPVPFCGIGANYRRIKYTKSKKFEDLKLDGMYTLNDLIKWNNLTVKVLDNGLK